MMNQAVDAREFAVLSGAVSTAMIETENGLIPLDWVACGDRVLTRDGGFQVVRWVARSPLDNAFMRAYPEVSPITVPKGSLGLARPEIDVVVSPSQLLPLTAPDGGEVLVSADVVGDPIYPESRSRTERFTYVNVLLDAHHLISVEGAWMGSLFTADLGVGEGDRGVMAPVAPILGRADALTLWAGLSHATAMRRA